jgi:uncharacterized protein YjiS (DUF1127 family)
MRRLDDPAVRPTGLSAAVGDGFQPAHTGSLKTMLETLSLWRARAGQRHRLRTLEGHRLRDIGVSREDALREAGKPFWRP